MGASNLTAAQSGDRRKALEVSRDTLAAAIDHAAQSGAGTLAQLQAQYRATLAELDELTEGKTRKAGVDELKRRREAKGRRSTADASANA